MKAKTTKTTKGSTAKRTPRDDLAREYRFDYRKSRANRFAGRTHRDAVVVVLDPDVAKVYRDPKHVNALLRATIAIANKRRAKRAG